MRKSLRKLSIALSSTLLAGSLVSCQASPGPAPVEDVPETTETTTETTTESTSESATPEEPSTGRSDVNIGIDTLRNGFNPHLIADDTALVRDIASLVLPSAFVGSQLNSDLLDNVESVPSADPEIAQTIRYTIAQEAQWSDGTPITGSDFEFLRRSMVSTPGTIDAAGYHAIAAVRTSGGGKTVEVDFTTPVADWHELFANLLPTHLIHGSGDTFETALHDAIPAAAGRYMVRSIDRQRGMVTLSRNDRFWGEKPANIEILTFHDANSASRAGEYLRTGQSTFMNLSPSETLVDTFSLMPQTDVRVSDTDRTLELTLNVNSSALASPERRAQVLTLIDVPLTARLAAARSANLSVATGVTYQGADTQNTELAELTATEPLRFAVDPADDRAVAAGRAVVDMLAAQGIAATTVTTDLASILAEGLPEGDIDGVITWTKNGTDALSQASRYMCEINLSGWCSEESETYLAQVVAGEVEFDPTWAAQLNSTSALSLPILNETRVEARTAGIVGPTGDASAWPGGIVSAPNWRKNDIEQ